MNTLNRYKQNLKTDYKFIYSYNTKVAKINHKKKIINCLGWWSVTTQKHINYAAKELGLELVK